MSSRWLRDACLDDSLPHFPLQSRLMKVMPTFLSGDAVGVMAGWKVPLTTLSL